MEKWAQILIRFLWHFLKHFYISPWMQAFTLHSEHTVSEVKGACKDIHQFTQLHQGCREFVSSRVTSCSHVKILTFQVIMFFPRNANKSLWPAWCQRAIFFFLLKGFLWFYSWTVKKGRTDSTGFVVSLSTRYRSTAVNLVYFSAIKLHYLYCFLGIPADIENDKLQHVLLDYCSHYIIFN